jgi:hypothetical protein
MKKTILSSIIFLTSFSAQLIAQAYVFDFNSGDHGFIGGVSDFGVNMSGQHMFTFDNRPLPSPLPTNENGQYMSGVNPSDDLFMYMKKQITGLQPFTNYLVTFYVEFASIYPTNAFGVGGAPGEGVTMKAGVTKIEPDTMIILKGEPFVVMNIDKGNQSNPGVDMDTIGHVGVSDTTTVYTLKTNNNASHPFSFTTDGSGNAWIIVGTDSGFEATTSLYFTEITADFDIVNATDPIEGEQSITVYPNPSYGEIHLTSSGAGIDSYTLFSSEGVKIQSGIWQGETMLIQAFPGIYYLQVQTANSSVMKKVVILR